MRYATRLARCFLGVAVASFVSILLVSRGECQSKSLQDQGFQKLESARMTLVSDLELDEELRSWPIYLDQAIEQWVQIFKPDPARLSTLHATVYLVGDRKKWEAAGLLKEVPFLEDGYQLGNKLYVVEQPSEFYRRMLFLHEATHWIMYEWLGGAGSPWLMEGMADYLSTHKIDNGRLKLGYFPISTEEVPWWGRILQVQNSMKQKNAPKLSEILSFSDMRQRRMDRYCWSWAAVYFFDHHPEFGEDFRTLYRGELDYSLTASRQLYDLLADDWKPISIQWRCFLDDLSFGYSPRLMLQWGDKPVRPLKPGERQSISIQAGKGWQATGFELQPGDTIRWNATGSVVVKQSSDGPAWQSTPGGISVEYHRGYRLGTLIGVLAPLENEQPSSLWDRLLIGTQGTLQATERCCLLLRVNDSAAGVLDNSGAYLVEISLSP